MTDSVEILERIQDDFTGRLNTLGFFSDINIFNLRPSRNGKGPQIADLQTNLNNALKGLLPKAGKVGAAVSVLMPVFDVPNPDMPGPQGELVMEVLAQEHPIVNNGDSGTGKSAESIAITVLRAMHHFRLEGLTETFYADKDAMTPSLEFAPFLTYRLKFRAQLRLPQSDKCLLPGISEGEALTVVLTNRTAEAAIYYTTDESFPSAQNEDATLYTAPFAVEAGTVVRWAAYKESLLGSDVGRATITL